MQTMILRVLGIFIISTIMLLVSGCSYDDSEKLLVIMVI